MRLTVVDVVCRRWIISLVLASSYCLAQEQQRQQNDLAATDLAPLTDAQTVAPEDQPPLQPAPNEDDYFRIPAVAVHDDFYDSPKFSLEIGDLIPASSPLIKQSQVGELGTMIMAGRRNERFLCQLPQSDQRRLPSPPLNTTDPQAVRSTAEILSDAIKQLTPMKTTCLYTIQGWWTFEYCHASHIRQFHRDHPTEKQPDPPTYEFMMGQFDRDTLSNAELGDGSPSGGSSGGLRGRYVSLRVRDGTVCDLTGKKRETEIKFYCNPFGGQDRMPTVSEVATCTYSVAIQTARLCSIPEFSQIDFGDPEKISCKKIVSDDFYALEKQRLAEIARKRHDANQRQQQQQGQANQKQQPPLSVIEEILRRAAPLLGRGGPGESTNKASESTPREAKKATAQSSGKEFVVKYGAGDEAIDVKVIYEDLTATEPEAADEEQGSGVGDGPPLDTEQLARLLRQGFLNLANSVEQSSSQDTPAAATKAENGAGSSGASKDNSAAISNDFDDLSDQTDGDNKDYDDDSSSSRSGGDVNKRPTQNKHDEL